MELVRGTTLRRHLDEHGPLDPDDAVTVVAARSPTPSTPPTRPASSTATSSRATSCCATTAGCMVADFGIAKAAAGADLTADRHVARHAAKYLAPEQVDGRPGRRRAPTSTRSALVLYEMLCGRPPFAASTERGRRARPPGTGAAAAPAGAGRHPAAGRGRRAAGHGAAPEDRYPDAGGDAAPSLVGASSGGRGARAARSPVPDTTRRGVAGRTWPGTARRRAAARARAALARAPASSSSSALGLGRRRPGVQPHRARAEPAARRRRRGCRAGDAPTVAIASAEAFDPDGDGARERRRGSAGRSTATPPRPGRTEGYNSRTFGNLKPGVGLVLTARPGAVSLASLTVQSPTAGWAAEVYVADDAARRPRRLGRPRRHRSPGSATEVTFDLGGARGRRRPAVDHRPRRRAAERARRDRRSDASPPRERR